MENRWEYEEEVELVGKIVETKQRSSRWEFFRRLPLKKARYEGSLTGHELLMNNDLIKKAHVLEYETEF